MKIMTEPEKVCIFWSIETDRCLHDDWFGHDECNGKIEKCNRDPDSSVEDR